jgi:hypothetical protein
MLTKLARVNSWPHCRNLGIWVRSLAHAGRACPPIMPNYLGSILAKISVKIGKLGRCSGAKRWRAFGALYNILITSLHLIRAVAVHTLLALDHLTFGDLIDVNNNVIVRHVELDGVRSGVAEGPRLARLPEVALKPGKSVLRVVSCFGIYQ